ASDASGIKDVKVFVDNNLKATLTSAPYTYSLDTRSLSEGNRTIKVEACDKAQESNCTSQTVVVNVNNATPVYTAKDADTDKSGKVDGGDLSRVLWFMALGEPVEPGTNGDA